jgi:hypothetical protein
MSKEIKQPRGPKDQNSSTRPSFEKVIENLDRWANSPGLPAAAPDHAGIAPPAVERKPRPDRPTG